MGGIESHLDFLVIAMVVASLLGWTPLATSRMREPAVIHVRHLF